MAKRKKSKSPATGTGVTAGLAAAADDLVRAAVGRLKSDAQDNADGDQDDERAAKKKRKKESKKDKRAKKAAASGKSRKGATSAEDGTIERLGDLAASARKRLAKVAKKLGSVTDKRRALIQELSALQQGIAAALEQFRSGSDPAENTPVKSSKKRPRRKTAAAVRARSSRRAAQTIDGDQGAPQDTVPEAGPSVDGGDGD